MYFSSQWGLSNCTELETQLTQSRKTDECINWLTFPREYLSCFGSYMKYTLETHAGRISMTPRAINSPSSRYIWWKEPYCDGRWSGGLVGYGIGSFFKKRSVNADSWVWFHGDVLSKGFLQENAWSLLVYCMGRGGSLFGIGDKARISLPCRLMIPASPIIAL